MNDAQIAAVRRLMGSNVVLESSALLQHGYDWWPVAVKWRRQDKQPHLPEVVVWPQSAEQVSQLTAYACSQGIPVTPWGAGSSVTGAPLAMHGGICLDMSAMNQIQDINTTDLTVTVQSGVMGHQLETALNEHGFTLNHSPQSLHRSTVGGWVATRATGQFSSRWGGIEDLVVSLSVVLSNGEVIETRTIPRAAIGPDLNNLFIGSEGTLGIVTEITLKIAPLAEYRTYESLAFATIGAGLEAIRRIMQRGLRPFLVRFYDVDESRHLMRQDKVPGNILLLGFEGIESVANAEHAAAIALCEEAGGQVLSSDLAQAWMQRRFDFSAVESRLEQTGGFAETIEVAHLWTGIQQTYDALKRALSPLADEVLGHFSHVYPQGTSLYMILLGQVEDDAKAEARLLAIWDTAMRICLEQGAAISHHHGIGIARLPYIRQDLRSSFELLRRVKEALDPLHILNPGKLGLELE